MSSQVFVTQDRVFPPFFLLRNQPLRIVASCVDYLEVGDGLVPLRR